jgi:hypothetical protein
MIALKRQEASLTSQGLSMAITARSSQASVPLSSRGIHFSLICHYQKGKPDYRFDNPQSHLLANYRAEWAESVLGNLGTFSAKFYLVAVVSAFLYRA